MHRFALLLALAASPAAATLTGSGTVDFTFTAFHGPFSQDFGRFLFQGRVNGGTPVDNGTGQPFFPRNGDLALSGQSVSFSPSVILGGMILSTSTNNIISFMPIASFTNQPRGVPFKIGTFTFTNGEWFGGFLGNPLLAIPSFFDFTLTTHSATPEFNQIINDSVKMTVNAADCSLPRGPEDQADFISIAGAPQLGSLRVYDSGGGGACTPAGFTQTGTIDLFVKFNSLDYVALRNPQGGFFSPSAAPGPLGGVPEPASWALMIAGFGLVGATARRRRSTCIAERTAR